MMFINLFLKSFSGNLLKFVDIYILFKKLICSYSERLSFLCPLIHAFTISRNLNYDNDDGRYNEI